MSSVNQFKIENLSNSKGLIFHSAQAVGDNVTLQNATFSVGGASSQQNFGRNFGGFKRLISINFELRDDGPDDVVGLKSRYFKTFDIVCFNEFLDLRDLGP